MSTMMPATSFAPAADTETNGPESARSAAEAERRQLTVMFCDLVGSTDLSGKLDPEDLREVVRAYQETAAEVIERYEGHIAQYLGDGLLIYFGFPVAHENDAQRAVYTGLGIPEAMATLNTRLEADYGVQLAVRIGIHTGPVVVGEMGGGGRHENLALGETPNIAARLEGLAQSNTTVISPTTAQLVQRSFELEELGSHELKGVAEPMMLYSVVSSREGEVDDQDSMQTSGFDALVGRDEEIGLLLRRWQQSKDGLGQVVLISGEAGIGKSSLVDRMRNYVRQEGLTCITFRCSPYHTNSAFYPIIEQVQRALGWQADDRVDTKLAKLEQALGDTHLPLDEAVPLLTSLLSLPSPTGRYPALMMSPRQQRQQTQDILVAWLLEEAEREPRLAVWEDLHWADPSSLETLGLFVDQAPTAAMLHVLIFRPEFEPPWPTRSHLTPITLNRLERPQVEAMITHLAGGKTLPEEVVQHIVAKTDGVPLYVEELTKMLCTSDLMREEAEQYTLVSPLSSIAIPNSLQDSLMARLDRLQGAKEIAQLAAVLGREFSYEWLRAIWSQNDASLQAGLAHLVRAELLYQRGRPPRANYIFKHALIQDAAYASLLRSTRQQAHQRVVRALDRQFTETAETAPELLAYHCTEAGLAEPAFDYWSKAGQLARERSAHVEAAAHFHKGLEVAQTLPESAERTRKELDIQVALGPVVIAIEGWAAMEVEQIYTQALRLCERLGATAQLFPVLRGLRMYHVVRGELQTALELGAQLLDEAQRIDDSVLLSEAHWVMGANLIWPGELVKARMHFERSLALYDAPRYRAQAFRHESDPGILCLCWLTFLLWYLGYPDQARQRGEEALVLAEDLSQPFTTAYVRYSVSCLHALLREWQQVQSQADIVYTLSAEQGFAPFLAIGQSFRGYALAWQGQTELGIAQMCQGRDAWRATGAKLTLTARLADLAEAYGHAAQIDQGLDVLSEALALANETGERYHESELHRLKGELLLSRAIHDDAEVETCFQRALTVAQQQQAKSWELRSAMSLARLWQHQSKRQDAYDLLAPVYDWFTEGFDTVDLKDAKALLDELRT